MTIFYFDNEKCNFPLGARCAEARTDDQLWTD